MKITERTFSPMDGRPLTSIINILLLRKSFIISQKNFNKKHIFKKISFISSIFGVSMIFIIKLIKELKMKQYNSLYNVILDAVVAIAFISTMIINACSISKVNDTLQQIQECKQNAKDYPTMKNQETMTLKADSLFQTIPSIYK